MIEPIILDLYLYMHIFLLIKSNNNRKDKQYIYIYIIHVNFLLLIKHLILLQTVCLYLNNINRLN
jgi:hypothetical protein